MIYLYTENNNKFVFHGSDRTSKDYFVFEFHNTQTNVSQYMTGVDKSSYPQNYNLFEINITSGATYNQLSASTINLEPGGYRYIIREADTNDISEIVSLSGNVVEQGIVYVQTTEDNWNNDFNYFLPMSGSSIIVWE